MDNAAQIYDLKSRMEDIKQGSMSVNQYHTELQNIWQELDLFYESDFGCAVCYLKQKRMIEKERVFEFLTGLNKELDEVRGRLLSRSPFPSIDDAFAEVRREEARKKVMLGNKCNSPGAMDGSALAIRVAANKNTGGQRSYGR